MKVRALLDKLIEIEDSLGKDDNTSIRKKVIEAQDCLMQLQEEKSWQEPLTADSAPSDGPMQLGWRRFLETYAPEFAACATEGSVSHNFSGGWGRPRR
jgi:hypothetical protein